MVSKKSKKKTGSGCGERWKIIKGHSKYKISSLGRVKTKTVVLTNKNGVRRLWRSRLRSFSISGSGYYSITLDGIGLWVHRLVATHFLPNPHGKKCVNHKNGNKLDNRMENLEWVTYKENMKHLMSSIENDKKILNMKLTKSQRKEIQTRVMNESDSVLAEEFCVEIPTIRKIRIESTGIRRKCGPAGKNSKHQLLNEKRVRKIRKLKEKGFNTDIIAKIVKSSPSSVRRVIRGETWKWVE